jgi:hypothetical protein
METLSIGVIISVISLFLWTSICFDKRRIRVNSENLGYKDIKITWIPLTSRSMFSLLFGNDRDRYYRVTHVGRDGDILTRQCKSSFVTGVYWLDEEKGLSKSPSTK